jgi:hypothetical protein
MKNFITADMENALEATQRKATDYLKSEIAHFKSGIAHFKSGIAHFKVEVSNFKSGIAHFKSEVSDGSTRRAASVCSPFRC